MSKTVVRTISSKTARRLFISRQGLAGRRPAASADSLAELFADLGCVQIDPIRAIERTQLLVLHSRLAGFDPALLEELLFGQRRLFEYWAHAASIVRVEDYPIFQVQMRRREERKSGNERVKAWLSKNEGLQRYVLDALAANGPLAVSDFEDRAAHAWETTGGWSSGRSVALMLDDLWLRGRIMVAGRDGNRKLWDLSERCLPEWTPRQTLPRPEAVEQAAERSLRALGVAPAAHIRQHFTRGKYPGLDGLLKRLEKDGRIKPVKVVEGDDAWPGRWYIHQLDEPLLDALEAGEWRPRTVLLSPFDNLICDRKRTEALFNFHFRVEIYVPKAKRIYGYYVMPILHGDRLIGRMDAQMDRKANRLLVRAIYPEKDAPRTKKAARAIRTAITDLASFLGATDIDFGKEMPAFWRPIFP